MPKLTLRRGLLAAAAIGLLLSPAPAQDKPPLNTHPIVERDPFTNTIPGNPDFNNRPSQQPVQTKPIKEANTHPDVSNGHDVSHDTEVLNVPDVQITGIVSNQQGRQAILTSNSNTVIVSVGEKVGDFHVSSITPESVTLSYQGRDHKIAMNSEF